MFGVSWGYALANDNKGRNYRKWQQISRRMGGSEKDSALTGAKLEQAVMAIAAVDPSLVKIQAGA